MDADSNALHRARTLFDHGMLREAGRVAEAGLRRQPEHGRLWEILGVIQHGRGEFRAACRAIETASLLVPLFPRGQCVLAETYLQLGQPEMARLIYRHLAELNNFPTTLLPQLAGGLGRLGEYHLALRACREAAQRQPDLDAPLYGMAFYMGRLQYPAEVVLPVLDRALSLAPDCMLYRVAKAVLLDRMGQTSAAQAAVRGLDLDALSSIRCARCLARLGKIYTEACDERRAAACRQAMAQLGCAAGQPADSTTPAHEARRWK